MQAEHPRDGRTPWLVGCALVFALLGGVFFFTILFVLALVRDDSEFSSASLAGPHVGRIDLTGPIEESESFLRELRRQERDPKVRALVVRVDSPGGGVAPSQEIYAALLRFKAEGRPVVVSMGSVAASGGYYVACAGDRIYANPGTLTGSIGVILSFVDASRLLDKIGVRYEVVKSGPRKDAGAYWRGLTDDERRGFEATIQDVYGQFTEMVADRRSVALEEVKRLADGRILSGREAFQAGLVDSLGDFEAAARAARDLAGLPSDAPVISKHRTRPDWLETLSDLGEEFHGYLAPAHPTLEYRFR